MKSIAIAMLLCLPFFGITQIPKGTWNAGGSGYLFYHQTHEIISSGYKSFGLNIAPSGGYFLLNNLEVGAQLGAGLSVYEYKDFRTKGIIDNESIGIYTRKYFGKLVKISPFFGLGISYSRTGSIFHSRGSKMNQYQMGLTPSAELGNIFWLNQTFAIEVKLAYNYMLPISSINSVSAISASRITLPFGVRYYFSRK